MNRYTEQQKQQWVREWKVSNLSAVKFSSDKPFAASSILYWSRKVSEKDKSKTSFFQVIAPESEQDYKIKLTFPSGITMEMENMLPIDQLKELISC